MKDENDRALGAIRKKIRRSGGFHSKLNTRKGDRVYQNQLLRVLRLYMR